MAIHHRLPSKQFTSTEPAKSQHGGIVTAVSKYWHQTKEESAESNG
jgi:hypothetical protein